MPSGIDLSFDYISDFIKSKNCLLLEEKGYIRAKDKIKILCSCRNNVFYCSFDKFYQGKITCNECSNKIRSKKAKNNFEDILNNIIKNSKYEYVSGEYINNHFNNLVFKDDNYYYKASVCQIQNSINVLNTYAKNEV